MELLRTLTESRGHAAVVVSHDPRLHEVADRVLRLADGRLKEEMPFASGTARPEGAVLTSREEVKHGHASRGAGLAP
jgi:ABC-type lipoprotein export system ATPase subunit